MRLGRSERLVRLLVLAPAAARSLAELALAELVVGILWKVLLSRNEKRAREKRGEEEERFAVRAQTSSCGEASKT